MTQYVIVNGFPGSGKTTFENACQEILGDHMLMVSSIDIIKQVAAILGWDGQKTPEARKFLSDLKQMSNALFDTTWRDVEFKVSEREIHLKHYIDNTLIVFIDVREPAEIQRYKDEKNATTVFIQRDSCEGLVQSNASDDLVHKFDYDYIIDNNGPVEDLTNKAKLFIIDLLKKGDKSEFIY